jgi:hypothetical protein
MKVTATLERLAAYQSNEAKLYGTPNTKGEIVQTYWANQASFQDDYVVATVGDFQESAGYEVCEISHEEVEEMGNEVLEINIKDISSLV